MRVARLVILLLIVTACGGTAATPLIVYVTPQPTEAPTASPSPSPSPSSSPSARPGPPTFTADDERIDDLIRDGMVEMLAFTERLGDTSEDPVDVMRDGREFAQNQLLLVDVYQPSDCTERALGFWVEAMEAWEFTTQAFLDWVAGGTVGQPDSRAEEAGAKSASALQSLDASC